MAFDAKYHRKPKPSKGQYVKAYEDGGKVEDGYSILRDPANGSAMLKRDGYTSDDMAKVYRNPDMPVRKREVAARAAGSIQFHEDMDKLDKMYPRSASPNRKKRAD